MVNRPQVPLRRPGVYPVPVPAAPAAFARDFPPAQTNLNANPGSLGVRVLGLYIISAYATDVMMMAAGVKPYLSTVTGLAVFLMFLLSGRALRGLQTKAGKFWLFLMIWLIIDLPFSYWPGGTKDLLIQYLPKNHMVFFYICAIALTARNCRTLVLANVAGGFVLLFECLKYGGADESGRFSIPQSISFANPNDVGLQLVVSMGLFVFLILNRSWLTRILGFAGLGLAFYFMLKTGSRGSLVACGTVAAFCICCTRYRLKVMMLGIPVALLVLMMPGDSLHRLTLIFIDPGASESAARATDQSSIESQIEREELLKASVGYMFKHPLFGIGPGQFSDYRWADMKMAGVHVASLGTHNSYMQMGAEAGIPALICFAGVIILSIRSNYRVFRRSDKVEGLELVANLSFALLLACIGYAVNAIFHHGVYSTFASTLGGTTCVLYLAAEPMFRERERLASSLANA